MTPASKNLGDSVRQIIQNMQNGKTEIAEAPSPLVARGAVLIETRRTLISAGTERMLVEFGRSSMLAKARKQPEKVKQVLAKIKTDGLLVTVDAVRAKLAQPLPLGYCNVGRVIAVGEGVTQFSIGDRVASNGAHADIVSVPQNLCARIPDTVDDDTAAFTVVSAIGLQGIRLAAPTLGELFVVTGVGLIGLLTVQMLLAQGCRVLAIDFDEAKLALARTMGAETCNPGKGADPVAAGMALSRGRGVDGVIITASTPSNDPVSQAAQMARVRGRIILVGVTGLELNRSDFYEKELSFQVSCSYGPGRYDPSYEQKGNDYPFGLVRWTEQRNFEAVLDLMSSGRLRADILISHRIAFDTAPDAYDVLAKDKAALGIILEFDQVAAHVLQTREVALNIATPGAVKGGLPNPVMAFIGAGNYASRVLIPAFKAGFPTLKTLVTSGGLNSVIQGESAGFSVASSDVETTLADPEIACVAIATRHDSHADLVVKALDAGKHVFVEKPLALTLDELGTVESAWVRAVEKNGSTALMVGFNRRFAPQIVKMKQLLTTLSVPKSFIITVNAGAIPPSHWTQDPLIGGGRIIGEGCHFIDLLRFLCGAKITSWQVQSFGTSTAAEVNDDKTTILLGFADGSFGTIHYLANGAASFPKERIEVFAAGRVLQIDNFRKMTGFGWPGFSKLNLWRQDKGQVASAKAFLDAVRAGTSSPIPADELFEVARVTIEVAQAARQ
jgi:predicted dehydrogenase/threonine dehydrogenase-like Zn-dependent dehydrogenase